MGSVYIERRNLADGKRRFVVRGRWGGREAKLRHLGTFSTLREANARAEWSRAEIAAGRVPEPKAAVTDTAETTVGETVEQWLATRIDLRESTLSAYRAAAKRLSRTDLWLTPVARAGRGDAQQAIARLSARGDSASAVQASIAVARQALDMLDGDNPLRDSRIRTPRRPRAAYYPPTVEEVRAMLAEMRNPHRLVVALLEATGMRIGEALALTRADLDLKNGRIRVAMGKTAQAARQVPVAPELLELLPTGAIPIFGKLNRQRVLDAMNSACEKTGVRRFTPHDLRHRRASIWATTGEPLPNVAQMLGHTDGAFTLKRYAHVIIDREDAWRAILDDQGSRPVG